MKKTKMLMILFCIFGITFLTTEAFTQRAAVKLKPVYYIQSVEYQPQKGDPIRILSTPGRTLIITGNLFERRPGKVALKGLLKLSGPVPDMELVVTKWANTLITANVPQAPWLLDSNATLVVTRIDGKKTGFPMKFTATRETKFVPHDVIHLTCPNTIAQCPASALKCSWTEVMLQPGEPGFSFPPDKRSVIYAAHVNCPPPDCIQINGQCKEPPSGTDTFTVTLKNGWVLKKDASYFNRDNKTMQRGISSPSITGPNSGQVSWKTKCAQVKDNNRNPVFCSNGCPKLAPESCDASWYWSLLMEGPKGVPWK